MARRFLTILLGTGLALLLAGLLGSTSPLLDLANLGQVPVALVTGLAGLALAWIARRRWKKSLYGLAGLAALAMLWPPADAPGQCAPDAVRLRLAWLNTQGVTDPAPLIAWLEAEQPDAVAFAELRPGAAEVRRAMRVLYPYAQFCHRSGNCGTVIHTRVPPVNVAALARGDPQNRRALSAVRTGLRLGDGTPFNLMATHLSRPLPLGRQREELAELEGHIEQPADTIILGDFNATRRTATLSDFASRNGLVAAAADGPTWPVQLEGQSALPLIQIDQLLVGRNWAVERLRTSGNLGSDHAGLVADLCRRI